MRGAKRNGRRTKKHAALRGQPAVGRQQMRLTRQLVVGSGSSVYLIYYSYIYYTYIETFSGLSVGIRIRPPPERNGRVVLHGLSASVFCVS